MSIDEAQRAAVTEAPAPRPVTRAERDPLDFRARVIAVDAIAIVLGCIVGSFVRFGLPADITESDTSVIAAALIAVAWLGTMAVRGAYDSRYLGFGPEEFKRVAAASLALFAVIASASYLLKTDLSRGYVLVSLPLGLTLILIGRMANRRWLHRRMADGRLTKRVLVVADERESSELLSQFISDPVSGLTVVGITNPAESHATAWADHVVNQVVHTGASAVAVMSSAGTKPEFVKELAWRIDPSTTELMVDLPMVDVAGPRVTLRIDPRLPLVHLDEPRYASFQLLAKRTADIVVSGIALIALMPLLLVIAAVIKLTSRGPVLFVQHRVGRQGQLFPFPKFRTMVDGAEAMRTSVIGLPDDEICARYKSDPRITGPGRFLRRWSLDELPQLWSVFKGDMSLVGPRPLLEEEMPFLLPDHHRRHIVKPGLTGLWQVSGRKELSWDERMRLDLEYVDTWSVALDAVLIARTFLAVIVGRGAH